MNELQLLKTLENDPRIAISDLAAVLAESESDVLDKLSELEKEKIICGYHTIINWDKTNHERVSAFIFAEATPQRDVGYDNIARKIYNYPEVESLHLISGENDFIILIHGETMKEIAEFTAMKLATIDGINSTNTLFILQTFKENNYIYVEEENKQHRLVVTP